MFDCFNQDIKLIFFLLLCWKIAEQKTNLFECFSNKYLSNYVGPNPGSDMIYIILYCIADLDWGDVIFKIWIRIFRHKEGQNIFLLNYQFLRKKKITVDIWLWLIGTALLLSNKNNLEVVSLVRWHYQDIVADKVFTKTAPAPELVQSQLTALEFQRLGSSFFLF